MAPMDITGGAQMEESEKHALRAAANLRVANKSLRQELDQSRADADLHNKELCDKIVELEKELQATNGVDSDELHDAQHAVATQKAEKVRRDLKMKQKKEEAKQKDTFLKAVHTPGSAPPCANPAPALKERCHLKGESPWDRYRRVASLSHQQAEKVQKVLGNEKMKSRRAAQKANSEVSRSRGLNSQIDACRKMNDALRAQLQEEADSELAVAQGKYSGAVARVDDLEKKAILRGIVVSLLMAQSRNQADERERTQVFICV